MSDFVSGYIILRHIDFHPKFSVNMSNLYCMKDAWLDYFFLKSQEYKYIGLKYEFEIKYVICNQFEVVHEVPYWLEIH